MVSNVRKPTEEHTMEGNPIFAPPLFRSTVDLELDSVQNVKLGHVEKKPERTDDIRNESRRRDGVDVAPETGRKIMEAAAKSNLKNVCVAGPTYIRAFYYKPTVGPR